MIRCTVGIRFSKLNKTAAMDRDKKPGVSEGKKEPNILPATEIASNPNPRANENIPERTAQHDKPAGGSENGINSEITDGEDA